MAGKLAPYMAMLICWVEVQPDISMPELAAARDRRSPLRSRLNARGSAPVTINTQNWLLSNIFSTTTFAGNVTGTPAAVASSTGL